LLERGELISEVSGLSRVSSAAEELVVEKGGATVISLDWGVSVAGVVELIDVIVEEGMVEGVLTIVV